MLVVGEDIPARELGRSTQESSAVLGRDVNVARYTPDELAEDLSRGDAFLRRVLSGPKVWVAGDQRKLEALAA